MLDPDRFPWPRSWVQQMHGRELHLIADSPGAVTQDQATALDPEAAGHQPLWALNISAIRSRAATEPLPLDWQGLQQGLQAGLTAARQGAPYWVPAPAGFTGIAPREVLVRWIQLATFAPLMCLQSDAANEPWRYDDETVAIARYYFELRTRLHRPLTYWGGQALRDGTPMACPMEMAFPDDAHARAADDQYLLGPDLIVAPLLQPEHHRNVYLPAGDWTDLWSGETHTGPAHVWVEMEPYQIPLFVYTEVHPFYEDLLPPFPSKEPPPIEIIPTGQLDAHGLPAMYRVMVLPGQVETFSFLVTNHRDEPEPLRIRLAPLAGIAVDPSQMIRFVIEPGETRSLEFDTRIFGPLEAGTYPLRLEVIDNEGNVPAPTVHLVRPPVWRLLGPFARSADPQPSREKQVSFVRATDAIGPREWQTLPQENTQPSGRLDLGPAAHMEPGEVVYLHTTLFARWPQRVRFIVGHTDSMTLWLNQRERHRATTARNAERDGDTIEAVLNTGLNHLLIRLERQRAPVAFYFRVQQY